MTRGLLRQPTVSLFLEAAEAALTPLGAERLDLGPAPAQAEIAAG
jgi:hypothetical protein